MNDFLRELKASTQKESNFQGMFFQVKHVNEMTMSK